MVEVMCLLEFFGNKIDNILKTVQDRVIVTMEDLQEFMYGLSNGMNTSALE